MMEIAPTPLAELARFLDDVRLLGDGSVMISLVVDDSRRAREGALFIGMRGEHVDGALFVDDALARGASAVFVADDTSAVLAEGVSALVVPDLRKAVARLAASCAGEPARGMRTVGITGTNGKTTTSFLISAIFARAGINAIRIGTLGAQWYDVTVPLAFTTPPPLVLHPLLAHAREDGVRAVVMEVSSHALALNRIDELPIEIGVFTNLTRDHLDFHETVDDYVAAKRRLFEIAEHAIFNLDDPVGAAFHRRFGGTGYSLEGLGGASAEILRAHSIELTAAESRFMLDDRLFTIPLAGRFNVSNALAAIAAARRFGISDEISAHALAEFAGVPGRMERINGGDCTVIIDYAHTPDALQRVLEAVRESTSGKLTLVFGCGGDRDAGKRPLMGAVAERFADRVIITSDNPRNEAPELIAAAISGGMEHPAQIMLDRRLAIERAVGDARGGDVVVIAGKGAELVQVVGSQRLAFDDRAEAARALAMRVPEHTA